MKKIPTLFKRVFSPDHKTKTILPEVTPGCEAVLEGRCIPTVKWDGACCAIINGEIYKRYDAKIGKGGKQKQPPEGAIPCQLEPDPITGHWPHWVKCIKGKSEDKYFFEAEEATKCIWTVGRPSDALPDGTYEAIGPAWQSNPYHTIDNWLKPHGVDTLQESDLLRSLGGATPEEALMLLRFFFRTHEIEGIVFWLNGQPLCKIKRSDFGFPWPIKKGENA